MNNYEFEAKVFRNIAGQSYNGGAYLGYVNLPSGINNEYVVWVDNLMERTPLIFTGADLEKYFYFLSYSTLSGSPNLNLLPQLLLSLIINIK